MRYRLVFAILTGLTLSTVGASGHFENTSPTEPQESNPSAHFHHLHLNTTDPVAAIDFYTTRFKSEKARFAGVLDGVWAQRQWLLFSKVNAAPPWELTSAIWHFGWGGGDMKATYKKHQEIGTKFFTPLTELGPDRHYAFAESPEHALIELYSSQSDNFGHLHLLSEDPVAAGEWYIKHFGAKPRTNPAPSRETQFRNGLQIAPNASLLVDDVGILIYPVAYSKKAYPEHWRGQTEMSPTKGRVVDHIGFSFENLAEAVERLRKDGVKITDEIRSVANGRIKFAFIEGPDKIRIELVEGQARKD